ncbi:MAG: Type 1 glutamine amidotransferase-like domain-containing protein [Parcubacteria group bacterium]|jgi:dipeptidase E
MKLLLTSTGLTNENVRKFFISQFDRLDNKTTCIVTSGRNDEEQFYIDGSIKELEDLGIKVIEFNIAKHESFVNFPLYDIYYVCGGNTFYILDRMRKTGVDNILINAVKKGKFYLGVSAGSIIPGPDIEVAGLGDSNDVNLKDLTGLKLVPHIITPHYNQKEESDVQKFKEKRKGESVIELTDDQAIFVEDGKMVMV